MKAEVLKKSILQMAIQGKLVPQNSSDEPASVLLQKIRAEKEKLMKEGKIKKDKTDSIIFKGEDGKFYEKTGKEVKDITDQLPFEIPESWAWSKITEFTYLIGDKKNQVLASEVLKTGQVPVVSQSQNLIDGYSNSVEKQILALPLIMFGDHTKIVKFIDFPFVIGADGTKFHKTILLSSQYCYLALLYYAGHIPSRGYARHYSLIKKLYFPIPPYEEQKRIVEAVEKFEPLLSEYDKLEQQAEKLDGEIFDKLKKSILQYAIQGKLVPQDSSDEPAVVLLSKIKAEKEKLIKEGKFKKEKPLPPITDSEKPFDIPDSWQWVRWGELSESIQYGFNAPAKDSGRIKMVRISDINENDVNWDTVPYCDIPEKEIQNYLLMENDILFARTGGTVGKSYLVKKVAKEAIYAGYLIRTRYSDLLCPEYLKYFMDSGLYWSQLKEGTIATAQPNCNGKTLSKMILPLPPLNEQKRIVARIEQLFAEIDKIKAKTY